MGWGFLSRTRKKVTLPPPKLPSFSQVITSSLADAGIASKPHILQSQAEILQIENGILFVVAIWSGPAIMFLKDRLKLLARTNLPLPPLHFVDSDLTKADFFPETFGNQKGGWCETFWFKDRRPVHILWKGAKGEAKLIHELTESILR